MAPPPSGSQLTGRRTEPAATHRSSDVHYDGADRRPARHAVGGRMHRRGRGGGMTAAAGTPARTRTGWTLALASLGSFLAALDVVVITTAIPVMREDLNASLSDLEWTVNAYNLVFACLMLTGAALGDRFGRRRSYVLGLLVFTAGSVAAALSNTAGELIASRVLQGVGAAVLMPLTLTLISNAFPVEKRGAA